MPAGPQTGAKGVLIHRKRHFSIVLWLLSLLLDIWGQKESPARAAPIPCSLGQVPTRRCCFIFLLMAPNGHTAPFLWLPSSAPQFPLVSERCPCPKARTTFVFLSCTVLAAGSTQAQPKQLVQAENPQVFLPVCTSILSYTETWSTIIHQRRVQRKGILCISFAKAWPDMEGIVSSFLSGNSNKSVFVPGEWVPDTLMHPRNVSGWTTGTWSREQDRCIKFFAHL